MRNIKPYLSFVKKSIQYLLSVWMYRELVDVQPIFQTQYKYTFNGVEVTDIFRLSKIIIMTGARLRNSILSGVPID